MNNNGMSLKRVSVDMDGIKEKVKKLFSKASDITQNQMETEFNAIMKKGFKYVEKSGGEVELASQMYELFMKYTLQLDLNLLLCKPELEDDDSGITEIIKKNKQYVSNTVGSKAVALPSKRGRLRGNSKKALSSLTYTGQMGTGGNRAITAAASQAIVDTKQLSQEHKIAGLKASLKPIDFWTPSTGQISSALPCVFPLELPIVKELTGAAHSVNPNMDGTRKYNGSGGAQSSQSSIKKNVGKPIDPNELRYCICNQVAFGPMVACDYKECLYEWYHCECVGVTDPPKGKWYCPECSKKM